MLKVWWGIEVDMLHDDCMVSTVAKINIFLSISFKVCSPETLLHVMHVS